MKVNVNLSIDDSERDQLANIIDGRETTRLATRKDVNRFMLGCLDAALVGRDEDVTEEDEVAGLRKLGFDDSYIRGWLHVGRVLNEQN